MGVCKPLQMAWNCKGRGARSKFREEVVLPEQMAKCSATSSPRFVIEWTRFAEQLRQREVPGFERHETQRQAEFEAIVEFYAQFDTESESDSEEERE